MKIESVSFKNGETIPSQHTCDGEGFQPEFTVSEIPKHAKSLALIIEDPDAPRGTFIHCVAWNIPPASIISKDGAFLGGVIGVNTAGNKSYIPPCPPSGTHRYFFIVYALSEDLSLSNESGKKEFLEAAEGKILEQAELFGIYKRP